MNKNNERGKGIEENEMGMMEGDDRVEGKMLGNGERKGNVDVVKMEIKM